MSRFALFWCFETNFFQIDSWNFSEILPYLSELRLWRTGMLLLTKSKDHKSNAPKSGFPNWYNSKIRPSTWRDVNKEYLPYPTYIHPYKKRGSDKQSQLPTNICHGHTVQITSYREYINIFVCKWLRLFLMYTVSLISSGETSRPQHITNHLQTQSNLDISISQSQIHYIKTSW